MASPAADATTLTIRGQVAASDKFGRLRFLLLEHTADGSYDTAWCTLGRSFQNRAGRSVPFTIYESAREGVRGEFHVTVPKRQRESWLRRIDGMRGAVIEVKMKIRRYSFVSGGEHVYGYALDLVELEDPSLEIAEAEYFALNASKA